MSTNLDEAQRQTDPSWLAHQLTLLSTQLSNSGGSTFGCTPTLRWAPSRAHPLRWSARIRVKEPRRRNGEAWTYARTPEAALSALLDAIQAMVDGITPVTGGEV